MDDNSFRVFQRGNYARLITVIAVSICAFSAVFASSVSAKDSDRTTYLLSRSTDGGYPNGQSTNAAVSHDKRQAKYIAYQSDATNIVTNDSNNATDVFVVTRGGSYGPGDSGRLWEVGPTKLVSKGLGGQPANGRSYLPQLDGDSAHTRPNCVAFISEASNLVKGDTNGAADAFVAQISSGKIERVSLNSDGDQLNGPTTEVSIDGACERVAFTSEASNAAQTKAQEPNWKTAVTGKGRGQKVYVRILDGEGLDKTFVGLTFLASNRSGECGQPSFGRSGKTVAFACGGEATVTAVDGTTEQVIKGQIYAKSFYRYFDHIDGKGYQVLDVNLLKISKGNGVAYKPSTSDNGEYIAYVTEATNAFSDPADTNGAPDVVKTESRIKHKVPVKAESTIAVSQSRCDGDASCAGLGNASSDNPAISDAGEFVLFDSHATNLRPAPAVKPDPDSFRDVFLWNEGKSSGKFGRNASLESRDSANDHVVDGDAWMPATSSRGNYVPFQTSSPLFDKAMNGAPLQFGPQIFMRYLGGK